MSILNVSVKKGLQNWNSLKVYCSILIITCVTGVVSAQQTFVLETSFPGRQDASQAWGDVDNDGDLDILLLGTPGPGVIYINNGNGSFTENTSNPFRDTIYGTPVFGDLDNDGDLDLVFSGSTFERVAQVFFNDGNGNFTQDTDADLTGVNRGGMALGDLDGDGDIDLIYAGSTGSDSITKYYVNDGTGQFTENTTNTFADVRFSSVSLGDVNNDGDLDVLLSGRQNDNAHITKLYINDGNGGFTESTSNNLVGIHFGSTAFADFNSDGIVDLFITGSTGTQRISKLYINNGSGDFTERTSTSFPGSENGALAVGDIDNDGDIDIMYSGYTGAVNTFDSEIGKLFLNNGSGVFSENTSVSIPEITGGQFKLADGDRDGDLDLFLSGISDSRKVEYYRNTTTNKGSAPTSPTNLDYVSAGGTFVFTWDASTDEDGGPITYNVFVEKGNGEIVVPAMADKTTGFRKITGPGNASQILGYQLQIGSINEEYFSWGVQAVDASERTSEFATQNLSNFGFDELQSSDLLGVHYSTGQLADFDNDGDLDFIISGYERTLREGQSAYYSNDGSGTFTENTSSTFNEAFFSCSAVEDFDNDGDPDYLLAGRVGSASVTTLYDNNEGVFIENTENSIVGFQRCTLSSGDIDKDGDVDFIISGRTDNGDRVLYYQNDGNGIFTENQLVSFPNLASVSSALADVNGDGYPDVFVGGINDERFTTLLLNTGSGHFEEITEKTFRGVGEPSFATGDVDNDGDLDVFISGSGGGASRTTILYRNDGDGVFQEDPSVTILDTQGFTKLIDLDNDGDLDLFTSGLTDESHQTKWYENDGNGNFTENTGDEFPDWRHNTAVFGDVDNDGDLDFILSGDGVREGSLTNLYINTPVNQVIEVPPTPVLLNSQTFADSIHLSWALPDSYSGGPITHNAYLINSTTGEYTLSPLSDLSSGRRLTPKEGNNGLNNQLTLYYPGADTVSFLWGVQTINGSLKSSSFAVATSQSISFQEKVSTVIEQVGDSQKAWGDVDNDGDLDLFLSGTTGSDALTKLYLNDGNGSFTESSESFPGIENGAMDLGDIDRDGDIDFILMGTSEAEQISNLYYNNGNGEFTEDTTFNVPGTSYGSIAIGDADMDGDLDLFISGNTTSGYITKMYVNDGSGMFTEETTNSFPGVTNSAMAMGDVDSDGDLDLFYSGYMGTGGIVKLYTNNGKGIFTENSGSMFIPLSYGSLALGDVDNDKDLDLIVTGTTEGTTFFTKLYSNDGTGMFTENTTSQFIGVQASSISLGDIDNDQDLDLFVTGELEWNSSGGGASNDYVISTMYINDGEGKFLESSSTDFIGSYDGTSDLIDVDNDGDLDLFLAGFSTTGSFSTIYENINFTTDQIPDPPTNLIFSFADSSITLAWEYDAEIEGPINFNVFVAQSNDTTFVASAHSDTLTGFRILPNFQNSGHTQSFTLDKKDLNPGVYNWGVQAINASKNYSDFSRHTFEIEMLTNFEIIEKPTELFLHQNYPNPFNPTSVIQFGVPNTAKVQLEVFDILGRKVMTLVNNETKQPGRYNVQFEARNLPSGMYIYRLVIGDKILTRKMTLIK